jgi:hypothetical protein
VGFQGVAIGAPTSARDEAANKQLKFEFGT